MPRRAVGGRTVAAACRRYAVRVARHEPAVTTRAACRAGAITSAHGTRRGALAARRRIARLAAVGGGAPPRRPSRPAGCCSARPGRPGGPSRWPRRRRRAATGSYGAQVRRPAADAGRCSATPRPPATACTGARRRPGALLATGLSPPAAPAGPAAPPGRGRLHVGRAAAAGRDGPGGRRRPRGHPDRRQRRHQPDADRPLAVRYLADAVRTLRAAGAEVVVGTCPDLGTIRPIQPPLRWLARRWSRQLAAAQTVAVVEAGGRTVSLGDLLGPTVRRRAGTGCSAGTGSTRPPRGTRVAAAALLPTVLAALGAAPERRPATGPRRRRTVAAAGRGRGGPARRHRGQRRPGPAAATAARPAAGRSCGGARASASARCRSPAPPPDSPDTGGTGMQRAATAAVGGSQRPSDHELAGRGWAKAAGDRADRRHRRRRGAARRRGDRRPVAAGTPSPTWAWPCAPRVGRAGAPAAAAGAARRLRPRSASASTRSSDTVGGQLAQLLADGRRPAGARCPASAVSGSRSTDLATQVARALLGERPDVAVILVGTNDATAPAPTRRGGGLPRPPRCAGCARPASRSSSAPAPTWARCARSRRRCARSSAGTGRRVARAQASAARGGRRRGGRPGRPRSGRCSGPTPARSATTASTRRPTATGCWRTRCFPAVAAAAQSSVAHHGLTPGVGVTHRRSLLPRGNVTGMACAACPTTPSSSPPPAPPSAAPSRARCATLRPDDLTATIVRAALDKVPAARPARRSTTSSSAAACPAASRASTWPGWSPSCSAYDHLPGATVTRYCSSSLQTTRMAFHAIKAGEGDVFVSAGVEMRVPVRPGQLRRPAARGAGAGRRRLAEPALRRGAGTARSARAGGGAPTWHDPREDGELPDIYIAMGQTAENLAQVYDVTREEMDEFGVRSQNLAEKAIADGFWAREITPVTLPDGTVVSTDDGPRAGRHPGGGGRRSSRSSARTAGSPPATAARSTTAPPRW